MRIKLSIILLIYSLSIYAKADPDDDFKITQAYYHFALGEKYNLDNNITEAIEEYKLALTYAGESSDIELKLGEMYLKDGNSVEGLKLIKNVIDKNLQNIKARIMYAEALISQKDYDQALLLCNDILKLEPQNRAAVHYKAILLVEKKMPNEAIALLKEYSAKNPEDELTNYYLATIYHDNSQAKNAEILYKKALASSPAYEPALLGLISLYEEMGNNEMVLSKLEDLILINPDNIKIAKRIVKISSELAVDYHEKKSSKSLEYYNKALRYLEMIEGEEPGNTNARLKTALIYIDMAKYDIAIQKLKDILQIVPDSSKTRYYLGAVYEEIKDYKNAIIQFMKIEKDSSLFVDSRIHAAYLYKMDNNYLEATKIIENAIVKNPDNPRLYDFCASLYESQNNNSKAIEILESSNKLFPENERLLYYLGTLYDKEKETNKALAIMEQIIKINPDNPNALNYIGYVYAERNTKLDEAEKLVGRAIKLLPKDPYVLDSLGWVYYKKGDLNKAVIHLEQAVSFMRESGLFEPVIMEHIAKVYNEMGLKNKVRETYKELLSSDIAGDKRERIQSLMDNIDDTPERLPASVIENKKKE